MGHIFYIYSLFTTLLLVGLISRFFTIKRVQEWYEKFEKVTGKKAIKTDFRNDEEYYLLSVVNFLIIFDILILIGGLITNSWYIYLFLFTILILLNFIIKPIRFSFIGKLISLSFDSLKVFIYGFLIINHFHLHIDLLQYLLTF